MYPASHLVRLVRLRWCCLLPLLFRDSGKMTRREHVLYPRFMSSTRCAAARASTHRWTLWTSSARKASPSNRPLLAVPRMDTSFWCRHRDTSPRCFMSFLIEEYSESFCKEEGQYQGIQAL